ncbi:MAG: type II toxin-antitoxin system PemK/MazF family toxin [Bacteroidota bacterium]
MARFVPKQGDFIALSFDPQSGHEQSGRRPAFVVSKTLFNQATGLAIVCPLTNTDRGYPFHVAVSEGLRVTGFIMAEQIRSVDFRSRHAALIEAGATDLLEQVIGIIEASF